MTTIVYARSTGIYDDSRATKEILALSEIAENVIVLAWDRRGGASEKCRLIFQDYPGIRFCFYSTRVNGNIGVRNMGVLLGWFLWLHRQLRQIDSADVIHACNLDAGLAVLPFVAQTGCRLVYDIYDYYADSHSLPAIADKLVRRLENSIVNRADVTILCNEERRLQIAEAAPRQVVIIHNSPDVEEPEKTEILFDYAYCGTLNGGRLVREILDLYPQNSDLRFLFAGNGVHAETARHLSEQFENFHFAGSIPYSEVLKLENHALALSAIYSPDSRNHRLCAPNKFYEALALGKAVIVCRGTGIDRLVETHGIGSVIAYDAAAFYEALRKLVRNSEQLSLIKDAARELYETEYRWSRMKDRLRKCYLQLEDRQKSNR